MTRLVSRRALIAGGSAAAATLVSGCDQISNAPSLRWILDFGQFMSLKAQRLLLAGQRLGAGQRRAGWCHRLAS